MWFRHLSTPSTGRSNDPNQRILKLSLKNIQMTILCDHHPTQYPVQLLDNEAIYPSSILLLFWTQLALSSERAVVAQSSSE